MPPRPQEKQVCACRIGVCVFACLNMNLKIHVHGLLSQMHNDLVLSLTGTHTVSRPGSEIQIWQDLHHSWDAHVGFAPLMGGTRRQCVEPTVIYLVSNFNVCSLASWERRRGGGISANSKAVRACQALMASRSWGCRRTSTQGMQARASLRIGCALPACDIAGMLWRRHYRQFKGDEGLPCVDGFTDLLRVAVHGNL